MADITALLMEKNEVVAEMAKKVLKRVRKEVENKGLKLRKSKMIASCGFLEDELRQCNEEGEVTLADSVETLGVRSLEVGSKSKSEKKEVQSETLAYQEE